MGARSGEIRASCLAKDLPQVMRLLRDVMRNADFDEDTLDRWSKNRALTWASRKKQPEFRRSQDSDFLIRAMLGKRYGVSAKPVYAYSQAEAATLQKTVEGYRYRLRCYRQYTESHPLQSRAEIAKTYARMGVYKVAGWLGAERRLIERRWEPITASAREAYLEASATVASLATSMKEAS